MGHQNYDFTERVYIDTSKDIYGLEEATYMNEYMLLLLENSEGQECYDLASLQNIIDVFIANKYLSSERC